MTATSYHTVALIACLEKRPPDRSQDDVELIASSLKSLGMFKGCSNVTLKKLSAIATYKQCTPNTTVIGPDTPRTHWYTVISGQLQVLCSGKKSLTLKEGDSFGESAVHGSSNSPDHAVITMNCCNLLCIEASMIRKAQKDITASPLSSLGPMPVKDSSELLSSDLHYSGQMVRFILQSKSPWLLADNTDPNDQYHPASCSGRGLVEWALNTKCLIPRSREQVVGIWQALLNEGIIRQCSAITGHTSSIPVFRDEPDVLYNFGPQHSPATTRKSPNKFSKMRSSPSPSPTSYQSYTLSPKHRRKSSPIKQRSSPAGSSSYQAYSLSPIFARRKARSPLAINTSVSNGYPHSSRMSFSNGSPRTHATPTDALSGIGSDFSSSFDLSSDLSVLDSLVSDPGNVVPHEDVILEECLNSIAKYAPDQITMSLLKSPEERTAKDTQLIFEELQQMKAFAHIPTYVKQKLTKSVVMDCYPHGGEVVFKQGDEADAWFVILTGSVDIMQKKTVICTLTEEDGLGQGALHSPDGKRNVSAQTCEDNTVLLRVNGSIFRQIVNRRQASTIMKKGMNVMVYNGRSSPESSPQPSRTLLKQDSRRYIGPAPSARKTPMKIASITEDEEMVYSREAERALEEADGAVFQRFTVKSGSTEKLLDHLVDVEADMGRPPGDTFVEDFFLTYPSYMSTAEVCEGLLSRYKGGEDGTDSPDKKPNGEQPGKEGEDIAAAPTVTETMRKQSVAQSVSLWIQLASSELVSHPTFQWFLGHLEDSLGDDGLSTELESIRLAVKKEKEKQPPTSPVHQSSRRGGSAIFGVVKTLFGTVGRNSSMSWHEDTDHRPSSSTEVQLVLPVQSPSSSQDTQDIRIYKNRSYMVHIEALLDETAESILSKACEQLTMKVEDHQLCEVKSNGEMTVLKAYEVSVSSKLTVNGKLFVLPKDSPKKVPDLVLSEQNKLPSNPFPDSEHARVLAAHLTIYDYNLFFNIQQMEFIYQAFEIHRPRRVTTNLDLLTRRFNEVYSWVNTEVCLEEDVSRRSFVVQKFIKIATHCLRFKNLNSFFAITMALDGPAVGRLKVTWKEIPRKLKKQFEYLKTFLDTTRNFNKLRDYARQQEPPMVPYLPVVLKDGFMIHQHNNTYVDGLVNFEKMQMLAESVRSVRALQQGAVPDEVQQLASKSLWLHHFISELKVIDNEKLLMEMSHSIEPRH